LSTNVRRRSHRIAQLEASKAAHALDVETQAERRKAKEERKWFDWPQVMSSFRTEVAEVDEVEEWVRPEWEVQATEECSEVRWEMVWTFS
jgi:hypothetical protein